MRRSFLFFFLMLSIVVAPMTARAAEKEEVGFTADINATANPLPAPSIESNADLFRKYDVAVIIDKSGSMGERDCADGLSRWDWCKQETTRFAQEAKNAGSDGITVDVFSDDVVAYEHVQPGKVAEIFVENEPFGGTQTQKPLTREPTFGANGLRLPKGSAH